MFKILKAKELTTNIYLMEVEAKRIAKNCLPGQFIIARKDAPDHLRLRQGKRYH